MVKMNCLRHRRTRIPATTLSRKLVIKQRPSNSVKRKQKVVDEKIFCCHGGLSPDLQSMEQIRRIMRPTDVPDTGLLCDLLWSDPDKDVAGWGENDRGVSFTFE